MSQDDTNGEIAVILKIKEEQSVFSVDEKKKVYVKCRENKGIIFKIKNNTKKIKETEQKKLLKNKNFYNKTYKKNYFWCDDGEKITNHLKYNSKIF